MGGEIKGWLWQGCCSRGGHGRKCREGRGGSESPARFQQVVSQEVVLGTLTGQAEGMRSVRGESQFHKVDGAGALEMRQIGWRKVARGIEGCLVGVEVGVGKALDDEKVRTEAQTSIDVNGWKEPRRKTSAMDGEGNRCGTSGIHDGEVAAHGAHSNMPLEETDGLVVAGDIAGGKSGMPAGTEDVARRVEMWVGLRGVGANGAKGRGMTTNGSTVRYANGSSPGCGPKGA